MIAALTTNDLYKYIGVIGFLSYMVGYALLQTQRIAGDGDFYRFLNLCGASLVLISMMAEFNLSSALISLSWIVISIYGFAMSWTVRRRKRSISEQIQETTPNNLTTQLAFTAPNTTITAQLETMQQYCRDGSVLIKNIPKQDSTKMRGNEGDDLEKFENHNRFSSYRRYLGPHLSGDKTEWRSHIANCRGTYGQRNETSDLGNRGSGTAQFQNLNFGTY